MSKFPLMPLSELVVFLDSRRRPVKAGDRKPGPFPYYGANGQQGTIDGYLFDEPLVLLAEDGGHFFEPNRGIAYKVTGKTWVNNHAHVLRPKSGVEINYLCLVLRHMDVTSHLTGTTRAKLTKAGASRIQIPLPPLAEQKRIAAILDAADALRVKRRESLAQLDTLLQSTFLDMFGDPVTNPKGFNRCRLGDQITLQRGKDITKKEAVSGEVPVISSGGVSFFHNESLITGPGVLLGRKGSVGKVHYSDIDFWPHDTTLYVKDFKGNIPRFVYHFFLKFPISHYEASAANPSLNRNNLHPVEVFWPPIGLQSCFATIVESVERQKARLREHLAKLDTLYASLQQRAFNGDL